MSRNSNQRGDYGFFPALIISLAVALLDAQGTFRCADEVWFDQIGLHKNSSRDSASLLLVHADRDSFPSSTHTAEETAGNGKSKLDQLVQTIAAHHPKAIAIIPPAGGYEADLIAGTTDIPLIAGSCLSNWETTRDKDSRVDLPEPMKPTPAGLSRGFTDLWVADSSLLRRHRTRWIRNGVPCDSISLQLAHHMAEGRSLQPPISFGVRFQGGPNSLPNLSDRHIHERSLADELIRGRVVMIGVKEDSDIGVFTPTTSAGEPMSRLEVHGNLVLSLASNDWIRYPGLFATLGLLMVASIIMATVFRQIRSRWMVSSAICTAALICVLASFASLSFRFQPPLFGLLAVCALQLIVIQQARHQVLARFFDEWKLLRRVQLKSARQLSYDEIWTSVAHAATQIFHPHKLAILELKTAKTHLVMRDVLGCDAADCIELRRDVSRPPFRSATERQSQVDITRSPFFRPLNAVTRQIVVPLLSGHAVQGMMVMEIPGNATDAWPEFEVRLEEFSDEMGNFLAAIRERELERLLDGHLTSRLRFLPERVLARATYQDEFEHRVYEMLLDGAISSSHVPVAIFDVFGRLIKANERMLSQLQELDIAVGEQDFADVLAQLTGRSPDLCRATLRACLIDGRSDDIVIPPSHQCSSTRLLTIAPLLTGDPQADVTGNPGGGFEYRSVIVQFFDNSVFDDFSQWQRKFVHHHGERLKRHAARLNEAVAQIQQDHHDKSDEEYLEIATLAADTMEQCRSAIGSAISENPEKCFLYPIAPILDRAIQQVHAERVAKAIDLRWKSPGHLPDVICNPLLMQDSVVSILRRLIQNDSSRGCLLIETLESDDQLTLKFQTLHDSNSTDSNSTDSNSTDSNSTDSNSTDSNADASLYGVGSPSPPPSDSSHFTQIAIESHASWISAVSTRIENWGATIQVRSTQDFRLGVEVVLKTQDDLWPADSSAGVEDEAHGPKETDEETIRATAQATK